MARISYPSDVPSAAPAAQPLLEGVKRSLGTVPNLFRLVAVSPATLEGYLGLNGALGKGTLSPQTRERIALAIANHNGCTSCNSAHGYLATHLAKLSDDEIAANRAGRSTDPKADVALTFALQVAQERGHVGEADLNTLRAAGYTDAQALEIVGLVALNVLTNYVNEVFGTDVDFPVAEARRAA